MDEVSVDKALAEVRERARVVIEHIDKELLEEIHLAIRRIPVHIGLATLAAAMADVIAFASEKDEKLVRDGALITSEVILTIALSGLQPKKS